MEEWLRTLKRMGTPARPAGRYGQNVLLDAFMLGLFTKDAAVITDNNPYTEFPLWRSRSDVTYRYWLDAQWLTAWKNKHFPK